MSGLYINQKPMRLLFIILALIATFCILSCKKEATASIVGKWNIVNDSTFIAGTGIFQGGSSNYIGISTDYFDLTSNDSLYVKEGSELDTATYSLPSARQVTFTYYSFNGVTFPNGGHRGPYRIKILDDHNLTLTLSGITPEGETFEIINLKR
jgi:hypothetical protein